MCIRDSYIATTPEKVWQAFMDTDVMRQYWVNPAGEDPAHMNVSDWKPGSKWEHQRDDVARTVDITGTVVECTPPKRLVYTWARPSEADDTEKHSRVSIDIELRSKGLVKLTITHEDLEKDPKMLAGISGGWPMIMSNLKTYLETGRAIPRSASAA